MDQTELCTARTHFDPEPVGERAQEFPGQQQNDCILQEAMFFPSLGLCDPFAWDTLLVMPSTFYLESADCFYLHISLPPGSPPKPEPDFSVPYTHSQDSLYFPISARVPLNCRA